MQAALAVMPRQARRRDVELIQSLARRGTKRHVLMVDDSMAVGR